MRVQPVSACLRSQLNHDYCRSRPRPRPNESTLNREYCCTGPRPRLNESALDRVLLKLAINGLLPRMRSADWQLVHGRLAEEIESGLDVLV